jgi:hypothetical protein
LTKKYYSTNQGEKRDARQSEVFEFEENRNNSEVNEHESQLGGDQDNLLFENSQCMSNLNFDDGKSQWNMSNFGEAERETNALRMSQWSSSQRDPESSKRKMMRKATGTFAGAPESQAENNDAFEKSSDDIAQEKLFLNSMMMDQDSSIKKHKSIHKTKSDLRLDVPEDGNQNAVGGLDTVDVPDFDNVAVHHLGSGIEPREEFQAVRDRRSESTFVRVALNSGKKVTVAAHKVPPRVATKTRVIH